MAYISDTINSEFKFDHCLLRTPEISDTVRCSNIIWENTTDTIATGHKNFQLIDSEKLKYDFRLTEISKAVNTAHATTSLPSARKAAPRDTKPDMGCYEYVDTASEKNQ